MTDTFTGLATFDLLQGFVFWRCSAAVRIPAPALKAAGLHVSQSPELRVEEGRLAMEPVAESLDDLLARMTPENRHGLALEGPAAGAEVW